MSVVTSTKINEAGGADAVRSQPGSTQRREVVLIREGWGSSGYYSKEVLGRDGPKIFPVGTHLYIDHPTAVEERDRPERSVRDLAATIVEAPRMAGIDLMSVVEVKEHWVPVIESLAEDIGLSIRASGVTEWGSAGGKDGPIVTSLTEGYSVDFVTKAGAGGKVGKLIESAREVEPLEEARNAANWFEARIHSRFTDTADHLFGEGYLSREERIGLSAAIGEALTAFNTYVDSNLSSLKNRDPFADTSATPVVQETGRIDGSKTEDANMADDNRLSELEESVKQLKKDGEETKTQLDEANKKAKESTERADRAEEALRLREAGSVVADALGDVKGLPKGATKRVVESVLDNDIPTHSDGSLDKGLLTERARAKAKEEQEYLASAGVEVKESKSTTVSGSDESKGDAKNAALAESFQKLGLSEEAAKSAAEGRS